jgi:hypothetical protein
MNLVHVVGNVRWRLLSLMRPPKFRFRRAASALPPIWREWAAESFLRRATAPGPAAEHIVQYLLSAAKSQQKIRTREEATVAKGAGNFYERQYRQNFNTETGAFARTATQALLASGGAARGHLWWHRRKTYAAMLDESTGAHQSL